MITREFKLYLNAGVGVAPVINANQFDQDEEWIFTLLQSDGTVYTPSTGAIIGLKSDGTTILNAGTVNSSGQVVITETEQMTAVPGANLFEILIDGNTHGTANFVVFVERRPGDIDNPSESDISLFQEAIEASGNITQFISDIDRLKADVSLLDTGLEQEASTRTQQDASIASQIAQEVSARQAQDSVLSARMDTFTTLTEGSTTGDAELADIRVGSDGTTYPTAGDAVRGQITGLKTDLFTGASMVLDPVWSQGILTTGNGSYRSSDTNRVCTLFSTNDIRIFTYPNASLPTITVEIPAGWKVSYREYDANKTYTQTYSDWNTTSMTIPIVKDYYYLFVLAKTDDSDITPSVIPTNLLTVVYDQVTDESLSEPYKIADSKAVGDRFASVDGKLTGLVDAMAQEMPFSSWIQGSISTSIGSNSASTIRVRSSGFESYSNAQYVIIRMPEGLKISARKFTEIPSTAGHQASVYDGFFPEEMVTGELAFVPDTTLYYRFVVGMEDDSEITPDEPLLADIQTLVLSKPEKQTLGFAVSANKLLGNVSIRSAKTVMFDDGTPPCIEWYLLQDVENNFYISKDLNSKQFLFKFVPPSSTASNWSCGIDGNNNVIFIKDAAGYTADDGERLNDNKRVNPIIFLASEGYSVQNTIDFGSSFKPAGWLSNVGWCVLPNKNVIFCEYTRGTLATCNVWHIDTSDITDPANWSVTWSHAIVDSTSAEEPEMKHCHDVQYDFYTGICYFGTGDGSNSSFIYYSTDDGLTWTLAHGPDRNRCRQVTYAFTKDYVYWASDNYETSAHNFYIAQRDTNGIIDIANARAIPLGLVNNQACYGCSYIQELDFIMFMDRNDSGTYNTFILQGYDIAADEIVTLGEIGMANGNRGGFRTKFIEWYPKDNAIRIGFNPRTGSVTPDTNVNAVCGNQGGTSGDGSTRINNLLLYIGRDSSGTYSFRFSTVYC